MKRTTELNLPGAVGRSALLCALLAAALGLPQTAGAGEGGTSHVMPGANAPRRAAPAGVSLSRKPLAPGAQRLVDVLVEVEGRQDQDPRPVVRPSSSRRVASRPSTFGIRTSIRITSGSRLARGDHRLERRRPPRRRPRCRARRRGSSGSPARTSDWSSTIRTSTLMQRLQREVTAHDEAAAVAGPGLERAAARARRARASRRARGRRRRRRVACGRRSRPRPRARRRASGASPTRCAGPAYLSVFVSASCTSRYAERSTPGGSSRSSPWTSRSTGKPGLPHGADQDVERLSATAAVRTRASPPARAAGRRAGASRSAPRGPSTRPSRAPAARAPARGAGAAAPHLPARSSPRPSARSRRGARGRSAGAPRPTARSRRTPARARAGARAPPPPARAPRGRVTKTLAPQNEREEDHGKRIVAGRQLVGLRCRRRRRWRGGAGGPITDGAPVESSEQPRREE